MLDIKINNTQLTNKLSLKRNAQAIARTRNWLLQIFLLMSFKTCGADSLDDGKPNQNSSDNRQNSTNNQQDEENKQKEKLNQDKENKIIQEADTNKANLLYDKRADAIYKTLLNDNPTITATITSLEKNKTPPKEIKITKENKKTIINNVRHTIELEGFFSKI